jgi:putative ABC transport system permease protein
MNKEQNEMYILQNAIQNLLRNKGRNLMIGAIIFAIILTTVISLTINNTASAVIDNYKDKFASEVSIAPDMVKVQEEAMKNATDGRVMMKRPTISSEQLLAFADSDYLKESLATGFAAANSDQITAIDQDDEGAGNSSVGGSSNGQTAVVSLGGSGNFNLVGDNWQDFTDGLRSLKDDAISAMPQADTECLISEKLAEENNLSVGDTISFTVQMSVDTTDMDLSGYEDGDNLVAGDLEYVLTLDAMGNFSAAREVTYELTITGIYADLTDEYANSNMPKMAALNRRNEIMTTLGTLLAERNSNETGISVEVTYFLKNPEMLADFEAEVRAKGLSEMFNVSTDTASYEKIVKPVEGLKSISLIFMLVVIILGALILLLLCSIAIRERKYEIGVLRAMGMKKAKVALGLWSEIFAITCLCLVLGLGIGIAAAQPVSDVLLSSQAAQAETDNAAPGGITVGTISSGMMIGGSTGTSSAQPLSEMEINLDLVTILEIIAIALVLSSFAGLISISKITKYEPIKILMERN